jgi:hypothetical protein
MREREPVPAFDEDEDVPVKPLAQGIAPASIESAAGVLDG